MKLLKYRHVEGYIVSLEFQNGEKLEVDMEALVKGKVASKELSSGKIDSEWGCLEFGDVDIEPQTLYRYAREHVLAY